MLQLTYELRPKVATTTRTIARLPLLGRTLGRGPTTTYCNCHPFPGHAPSENQLLNQLLLTSVEQSQHLKTGDFIETFGWNKRCKASER